MASIRENRKNGKVISYQFVVSLKRNAEGKQIRKYQTWTPPSNLTPSKAKKLAEREADKWECQIREEYQKAKSTAAIRITPQERRDNFSAFVKETWLPLQVRNGNCKPTTIVFYENMIAKLYDEEINHDLLLAGVLLHDFGKVKEFTISELGLVTDYSIVGHLMGHSTIWAEEIAEVGELLDVPEDKVLLLKHLILSHHGQPDFGAAVKPMRIEAELLSCIDMIDSRVEIYAEATATLSAGEFTPRIYALDKRVFKHR